MKNRDSNQKMNSVLFLMSLLIFIVGIGIFIYPAVSNYFAEKNQKEVIHEYQEYVNKAEQEEIEHQWELAETYNENLAGDPVHDPFIPGTGYALPDNYMEVLNINHDSVMGYVEIPKIGVYLPIFHGTSEQTLENGAGHIAESYLPIGGKNRHSIISAHRGLPSAELFTRLDEMEIGDVFYIHVLDATLAYEVNRIDVIEPSNLELLSPDKDMDLVTLLTCTPYGVNTHRLLVRGSRIPYDENVYHYSVNQSQTIAEWIKEYIFAIVIGIVILIVMIIFWKRKQQHKRAE